MKTILARCRHVGPVVKILKTILPSPKNILVSAKTSLLLIIDYSKLKINGL
jgi:hypothetical protein